MANAIAHLVAQARTLGIDASRIVLAGHSAGAHLSALVATDPQYLRRAGLGLDRLVSQKRTMLAGAAGRGVVTFGYTRMLDPVPARR